MLFELIDIIYYILSSRKALIILIFLKFKRSCLIKSIVSSPWSWIALILVALIIFFINCNVGLTNTTTLSISSGNNLDSLFICSMSKCRLLWDSV